MSEKTLARLLSAIGRILAVLRANEARLTTYQKYLVRIKLQAMAEIVREDDPEEPA